MSVGSRLRAAARPLRDWLRRRLHINIETIRPRVPRPDERVRYAYQRRHIDFAIPPGARVLDVGCGNDPFPHATVLVDRYAAPTHHRDGPLARDGRTFVQADICELPFPDKSFDYVYCAHVLEHVADPLAACRELMRVGRRGYIETPTLAKDMLFVWRVPDLHRWHVVAIADRLCFFELSPRQWEGIRSGAWRGLIFGPWHHPLQDAFFDNADLFNVMFPWEDRFRVHVFHLDGRTAHLDPGPAKTLPRTAAAPAGAPAAPAGPARGDSP